MGILLIVSVTQYVRGEAYCLVRAQAVTGTVTGCHKLSQRLSHAVAETVTGCYRLSQGLLHHVHASVYVFCCVSRFTSGDASIPANR